MISTQAIHRGEMAGNRSRTVILAEFMESRKFRPLKHVGVGACASAHKPAVPTRADLCYEVVDREIVAKMLNHTYLAQAQASYVAGSPVLFSSVLQTASST